MSMLKIGLCIMVLNAAALGAWIYSFALTGSKADLWLIAMQFIALSVIALSVFRQVP